MRKSNNVLFSEQLAKSDICDRKISISPSSIGGGGTCSAVFCRGIIVLLGGGGDCEITDDEFLSDWFTNPFDETPLDAAAALVSEFSDPFGRFLNILGMRRYLI
jgi:hypothetical protein